MGLDDCLEYIADDELMEVCSSGKAMKFCSAERHVLASGRLSWTAELQCT